MRFRDRRDAGAQLGGRLAALGLVEPLVLALPRGGVPVGAEVARALGAELEVLVARKVGAPSHPEFAMGAVAEGGGRAVDWPVVRRLGLSAEDFEGRARREEVEVATRVARYREGRQVPDVHGRAVVLVDDGLATGMTAEAALRALIDRGPSRLVLAVPVSAGSTVERLSGWAEVVCCHRPDPFHAVGQWYEDFTQTTDEEVLACLAEARAEAASRAGRTDRG